MSKWKQRIRANYFSPRQWCKMRGRSRQNALPVWKVHLQKSGFARFSWPNHKINGHSGSPKSPIQANNGQNSELVTCWFAPFGQLDMASQRCLVADCGFCSATSALAPLVSRRGKNWKSECRPDMIRMIENHRFLMIFVWPLKSKIESPRRRNANFHSWVTRLPIEMNVHVANIFSRLLQIPAFCLLPSKIRMSNSSPLQGRRGNRLPCF